MISNFGRVKMVANELVFKDSRVYQKESMINKPTLANSINHFLHDHVYFIRGNLRISGRAYNFSIARTLYYCFIKKVDLKEEDLMVVCRDGNGRNFSLSNLQMVDRSERQLRMIRALRSENILLRPKIRKLTNAANRERLGKLIAQYNKKGKRLTVFNSIVEAAEKTGININTIANVARGVKFKAGCFHWNYSMTERIDLKALLEKRKEGYKEGLRKVVSQYNMNGKRIAIYKSLLAAELATGILAAVIGGVVNGKRKTVGSFFGKNGSRKYNIDLSVHSYGKCSGSTLKRRKVKQFTVGG